MMHKAFLETEQRPFPLPDRPWLMAQAWHHLLFCHWEADKDEIEKLLPEELKVDLYQDKAYIGIVPFKAKNTRMRHLPRPPYIHTFLEMNIRTYVTYKGVPGIYFLTMEADKWLAVTGPRVASFLPYRKARMHMSEKRNWIHFQSETIGPDKEQNSLDVLYRPAGKPFSPYPDSLAYWLFERYCYFTVHKNTVYRGDIHHSRWSVHEAEVMINKLPVLPPLTDIYKSKPLFHYSLKKQTYSWSVTRIG